MFPRFVQVLKSFTQSGNTTEDAWTIIKKLKFDKLLKDDLHDALKYCNKNFRGYGFIQDAVDDFIKAVGKDPDTFKMRQPKNSFISDKVMHEAAEMYIYLTSCSKSLLYWTR